MTTSSLIPPLLHHTSPSTNRQKTYNFMILRLGSHENHGHWLKPEGWSRSVILWLKPEGRSRSVILWLKPEGWSRSVSSGSYCISNRSCYVCTCIPYNTFPPTPSPILPKQRCPRRNPSELESEHLFLYLPSDLPARETPPPSSLACTFACYGGRGSCTVGRSIKWLWRALLVYGWRRSSRSSARVL